MVVVVEEDQLSLVDHHHHRGGGGSNKGLRKWGKKMLSLGRRGAERRKERKENRAQNKIKKNEDKKKKKKCSRDPSGPESFDAEDVTAKLEPGIVPIHAILEICDDSHLESTTTTTTVSTSMLSDLNRSTSTSLLKDSYYSPSHDLFEESNINTNNRGDSSQEEKKEDYHASDLFAQLEVHEKKNSDLKQGKQRSGDCKIEFEELNDKHEEEDVMVTYEAFKSGLLFQDNCRNDMHKNRTPKSEMNPLQGTEVILFDDGDDEHFNDCYIPGDHPNQDIFTAFNINAPSMNLDVGLSAQGDLFDSAWNDPVFTDDISGGDDTTDFLNRLKDEHAREIQMNISNKKKKEKQETHRLGIKPPQYSSPSTSPRSRSKRFDGPAVHPIDAQVQSPRRSNSSKYRIESKNQALQTRVGNYRFKTIGNSPRADTPEESKMSICMENVSWISNEEYLYLRPLSEISFPDLPADISSLESTDYTLDQQRKSFSRIKNDRTAKARNPLKVAEYRGKTTSKPSTSSSSGLDKASYSQRSTHESSFEGNADNISEHRESLSEDSIKMFSHRFSKDDDTTESSLARLSLPIDLQPSHSDMASTIKSSDYRSGLHEAVDSEIAAALNYTLNLKIQHLYDSKIEETIRSPPSIRRPRTESFSDSKSLRNEANRNSFAQYKSGFRQSSFSEYKANVPEGKLSRNYRASSAGSQATPSSSEGQSKLTMKSSERTFKPVCVDRKESNSTCNSSSPEPLEFENRYPSSPQRSSKCIKPSRTSPVTKGKGFPSVEDSFEPKARGFAKFLQRNKIDQEGPTRKSKPSVGRNAVVSQHSDTDLAKDRLVSAMTVDDQIGENASRTLTAATKIGMFQNGRKLSRSESFDSSASISGDNSLNVTNANSQKVSEYTEGSATRSYDEVEDRFLHMPFGCAGINKIFGIDQEEEFSVCSDDLSIGPGDTARQSDRKLETKAASSTLMDNLNVIGGSVQDLVRESSSMIGKFLHK